MSSFTICSMACITLWAHHWIGIAHELAQSVGHDLPGHAEAVREPPALRGLATVDETIPIVVDLGLGLAVDDERDRRRELEVGPAVEGHERVARRVRS